MVSMMIMECVGYHRLVRQAHNGINKILNANVQIQINILLMVDANHVDQIKYGLMVNANAIKNISKLEGLVEHVIHAQPTMDKIVCAMLDFMEQEINVFLATVAVEDATEDKPLTVSVALILVMN